MPRRIRWSEIEFSHRLSLQPTADRVLSSASRFMLVGPACLSAGRFELPDILKPMKTIKIQKYINEKHEKTLSVPVVLVDALSFILPQAGVSELQKHGIDLPALEQARRTNTPYTKTIEVKEGGVPKKLIISLE